MAKLEQYSKKTYDTYGRQYQQSRDERRPERLYNECYELPSMIKAVGQVKGKQLLDVGCGAGIHTGIYKKKGAKVVGCDISKTMIELARERCKGVEFSVCSMTKMPYKEKSFGILTVSLAISYVKDLERAFKETARVLKKGGMLYFSAGSDVCESREFFENENFKARAIGYVYDKKKRTKIPLGTRVIEQIHEYEMVPGMIIKGYTRSLRTYLLAMQRTGFELVDIVDCEPNAEFRKRDPESYELMKKMPLFSIYVCRKK